MGGVDRKRPLSEILRGAIRFGGHAVYKFIIGKSARERVREREREQESEKERIYYECAGVSGLFD